MMTITAFYASLLAVLFLFLSVRVIGWRREQRVEIGHGEDSELLRRMRVHANFAEYVPFTLLLMALAESMAPPHLLMHLVGSRSSPGACCTPTALSQTPHDPALPRVGHVADVRRARLAALICFSLSALFLAV